MSGSGAPGSHDYRTLASREIYDGRVVRLRVDTPALVPKVILTTGDAIDDAMPGSVLATHPHVLQKPFDLATLRSFVERLQAD